MSIFFGLVTFANVDFLTEFRAFVPFQVFSTLAAVVSIFGGCLLFAGFFAFMIAHGKISSILRAFWRGLLVPLSVLLVLNTAYSRLWIS